MAACGRESADLAPPGATPSGPRTSGAAICWRWRRRGATPSRPGQPWPWSCAQAPEPMPSYDEVPYPNLSHVQSHPDALATLATLLGLQPAPINACRVLEIGCAQGGNLIPM